MFRVRNDIKDKWKCNSLTAPCSKSILLYKNTENVLQKFKSVDVTYCVRSSLLVFDVVEITLQLKKSTSEQVKLYHDIFLVSNISGYRKKTSILINKDISPNDEIRMGFISYSNNRNNFILDCLMEINFISPFQVLLSWLLKFLLWLPSQIINLLS